MSRNTSRRAPEQADPFKHTVSSPCSCPVPLHIRKTPSLGLLRLLQCWRLCPYVRNLLTNLAVPHADPSNLTASLTAVSILLSSSAHTRLVSSLTAVLHSVSSPSPHTSLTTQAKTVECHLRALKSLFSDLVAVVGPRAWGTQVVGASIDVEERRDAEGLWEVPVGVTGGKLPASGGKGKGKEGDLTMGESLAGAGGVDLERLQRDAQVALDAVFRQPMALESHSSGSSSSRPAPALLPSLISVLSSLTPSSSSTASPTSLPLTTRLRLADLICSFLAGVVRLPEQRFVLTDDEQGRAVLTALRGLVEEGSDKVKESALNALTAVLRESPDAMLTLLSAFLLPFLVFPPASTPLSADLGTGISYASRLTPFTSLLSSSLPSLRLAASTLCAVIAKLIYPPPEMQIPTEGQGDFGVGLVVGLLGLIEREKELRGRAAFTFGAFPVVLSVLPSLPRLRSHSNLTTYSFNSFPRRGRAEAARTSHRLARSADLPRHPLPANAARSAVPDAESAGGRRSNARGAFPLPLLSVFASSPQCED